MVKTKISIPCTFGIGVVFLTLTSTLLAASNSVASCGTIITSPGTWTLTQNLTCPGDGIDVQAGNVTLKLNGFTITGPGTNAGTNGVLFASPNGLTLDNVTILGPGTITKFQDGIVFQGTNGGGSVDVAILGNLIGILLRGGTAAAPPKNLIISQNTLHSSADGISGSLAASTIVGNSCSNSSDCIDLVGASGNKIVGNFCNSNSHAGIVVGANGSGSASTGNTIEGNQTSNNRFYGIFLGPSSSSNHLIGNVAFHNSFLDINEFNSHCGSDTFLSDVFGTTSQSCVK
jgi:parallel beta-helix repeat protein